MTDTKYAAIIESVARRLLGEPNKSLSSQTQLRFGSHGSIAVEIGGERKGTWYDHEAGRGGGVLDLVRARTRLLDGEGVKWLEEQSFIPKWEQTKRRRIVATYDYHDAEGNLLFQVVRYDPKDFRQRSPSGTGGWNWKLAGIRRVPYRLPELLRAAPPKLVFICEGEKDCDALHERGLIATTNPGGAGKWHPTMSAYLRGHDVVVLPHNDKAGEAHAEDVAQKLRGIATSVRIMRLPGLATKGDAFDWLAADGTAAALVAMARTAEPEPATEDDVRHSSDADRRPVIRVIRGKRHEAADAGLAALAAARVPFYVRDRGLVRICAMKAKASDGSLVTVPAVTAVTPPILGRALGQVAQWESLNRGSEIIPIDPPKEVVEQIAGMIDEWPFPPLYGVISTPTMRTDGSLLITEGYDPATGYVLFAPPPMPPIAASPSKQDALDALATLNELLVEFPFANDASRSVAMSMLLTPVLRAALPPAVPMHVITAPEAGSGKSYLQDIASVITTGDRCAVLSVSDNPDETEKRLIGAALAQLPIIALDNVSDLLMGDFLCQATERPVLQIRPLGTSNLTRICNTFTVFANGNNMRVGADAVRRTVQCALDSGMECPETREFVIDPVAMVLADRGKYVGACLTIARAYVIAGRPGRTSRRASYEGWSDTVRSALVWLNWRDPVETVANAQAEDPIRQQRAAVFAAWSQELVMGIGYPTSEIIKLAEEYGGDKRTHPALWDSLFAIAAPRSGYQQIDPKQLGKWLSRNIDTIASGQRLTVDRADKARPRWKLILA